LKTILSLTESALQEIILPE